MTSLSDLKELDLLYAPSRWVKRCSHDEVVPNHIAFSKKMSQRSRETLAHEIDVPFGSEETDLMDIFGADLKPEAPLFVYIHGGFWKFLDKDISSYSALTLCENGIKVVVPHYDLAPKVRLRTMVEQIRRMAVHVLTMAYKSGSKTVYFGGHSAGAHLAATLIDETWLSEIDPKLKSIFKGLILISGIYDLNPISMTKSGVDLHLDCSEIENLSPMLVASKQQEKIKHDLKVYITVAQFDSPAFIKQTEDFYKVIKELGFQVKYSFIKEMDHFNIVEKLSEKDSELTRTTIQLLKFNSFG